MQELKRECKECGTWKCKGCSVAVGALKPNKAKQPVLEVKKSEQLTLNI